MIVVKSPRYRDRTVLYANGPELVYPPNDNEVTIHFEDAEDCRKFCDKLLAWKRLKDFGCGFMLDDHFTVKFVGPDARKITSAEEQKSLSDSYKLLFGGEE